MQVHPLASTVTDNFFYLVEHDGQAALVDPIDPAVAIEAVRERELELVGVLQTHWHPDHVRGTPGVLAELPDAILVAGEGDADMVDQLLDGSGCSVEARLEEGEAFVLSEERLEVVNMPGHTAGHVGFRAGGFLLSGDVIFRAGVGHCKLGGDPGVSFRTFRDVLRGLDDDLVYCPGHDYTTRNLEFALSVWPQWDAAREALETAREAAARSAEGVRTIELVTLGEERAWNIFMCYDTPELQERLRAGHEALFAEQLALAAGDADEATWRTLRRLRDVW